MVKNKLTSKRERFCQEYMVDLNATQAAVRAKYSKKTARVQGGRLLLNVAVQDRLAILKAKVQVSTELTVKSVIDGILDTQRRAREEGNEKGIELKASDMLAKHVGAYEKNNEQQAIVIEQPLTEAQLKARLAAIGQAGTGLDNSSIG